jgi:hypothetical protein
VLGLGGGDGRVFVEDHNGHEDTVLTPLPGGIVGRPHGFGLERLDDREWRAVAVGSAPASRSTSRAKAIRRPAWNSSIQSTDFQRVLALSVALVHLRLRALVIARRSRRSSWSDQLSSVGLGRKLLAQYVQARPEQFLAPGERRTAASISTEVVA